MGKDYSAITDVATLQRLAAKLLADGKPIGFDVETGYYGKDAKKRSVDHYHPDQFVVGFSITNSVDWARYVPLRHDNGGNIDDPEAAWEAVREVLTKGDIVAHNAKFERAAVRKAAGIVLADEGTLTDTMLDVFAISPWCHSNFRTVLGLKDLVEITCEHKMMHIHELWPDLPTNKEAFIRFNTLDVTPEVVAYACEDAAWVLALRNKITDRAIYERPFIRKLEHIIMPIVDDMERFGVEVDWDGIEAAYALGQTFLPNMENYLKEELGKLAERDLSDLNFNSPQQMKKLLFQDIGLKTTRLTAKGKEKDIDMEDWQRMSTDKKSLTALAKEHDSIKKLLEFREVTNLLTRMKSWLNDFNQAVDGRVHANYKQAGAEADDSSAPGSGRFSASDPAIQQLPKGNWQWAMVDWDINKPDNEDRFKEFRKEHTNGQEFWYGKFRDFIIAAPDTYLLTFDYSQVELRMLAGASQEPALLDAFKTGVDVHSVTAGQMLGKRPEDVDEKEERPIGKTFNFALLYGMGIQALGEQLGVSQDKAEELYRQYFAAFSRVGAWMEQARSVGLERRYAETIFGRKIPVWALGSDKKGIRAHGARLLVNAPIQGGAADYMKLAMTRVYKELRKRGWWGNEVKLVMNQHDALTFEVLNTLDPNVLRAVLQECVVFGDELANMQGYPAFKADWEMGQRWGSSTKFPLEAVAEFDGEMWTVAKNPQPTFALISVKNDPDPNSFKNFIQMLKANPGETKVSFMCPQGTFDIPYPIDLESVSPKVTKLLESATIS